MEIADAKGVLVPASPRTPLLAGADDWMGIGA
ncbi:MAG: hypothetical protein GAK33_07542 [Burkholderia lata]|uniref:Uncharacterized protein n=1 Tax=Burkholderia lata (strain ATCC 17760 / DSM 23089 / LMG 22485 / NCIMB 9086 / R18194 / 383) TaxID=482957 RepID=A0A833UUW7_BURL3|nr:MAG: hypothetical protein GAK33_07542 [Burkholderia lata]